jgi:hypothetical protein
MPLGQQQGRPVTPFSYTVDAITGAITSVDNFSALGDHTDDTYLAVALGGGSGAGATADVVVSGGDVQSVTIVNGGTGYAVTDTGLTIPNGTIGGAAPATCDVATLLGEAATVSATGGTGFVTGDAISADELASTAGVGTPETGGVVSAFTITAGGTGYVAGVDTGDYSGTGEIGISDDQKYYDHDQYELGGDVEEYKTGVGAVATVATGAVTALVGGVNYRVGDVVSVMSGDGNATATIDTVDADGAVTGFTAGDTGTNYVDGDYNTDFVSRVLNQTATGEYAGTNPDNDPTITVGRLADGEQLIVQQRDIDGGAITVFAEPTTVNASGTIVGNTIRAEDITDQYRCEAVLTTGGAQKFVWVTEPTGDGDTGSYGYCTDRTAADITGDAGALEHGDCPVGSRWDGATGCETIDAATVNTEETNYAADPATGYAPDFAYQLCFGGGNYYEPNAPVGSRCIDGAVADNFSLGVALVDENGDAVTTTSSAQDYARTICKQMGYEWHMADYTCNAITDVTTLVTQETCVAAGHVWVAGTCYDRRDFGDGYSRQGNEGNTDPGVLPK